MVDIIYNGSATFTVKFRNTGNTAHTFFIGASIRDPNGAIYNADVASLNLQPGAEGSVEVGLAELKPQGAWDAIVSIWRVSPAPGTPESDRLANTGWLTRIINVLAPEVIPPVEVITAEITEVLINNERVI